MKISTNFFHLVKPNFTRHWALLTAFCWTLLGSAAVQAQVSVTATAGTPGPTVYTTLKDAFDAVNLGTHQGAITVAVTGNTTETASAVLNASGSGAASYTAVGISPSGGAARTITGAIAGHLIDLNGADNVTIDGLNSGGNSLTVVNTDIGASTAIRFITDATNNIVTNTTLQGSGAMSFGVVLFSTGTTTGNDGNNINNCSITAAGANLPLNGIFSLGTSAAIDNSGIIINNNNISDFFNAGSATNGIHANTGSSGWTITNNKLFQTAVRTYTTASTHNGINAAAGDGYTITGNTIGYATSTGTGVYTMAGTVATRFIAIALAVGTTNASSVQNNTFTAYSLATLSGATTINGIVCGINVTSGNVNIGTSTGNTIGGSSGVNLVTAASTTSGGLVVGINSSSTGTISIQNNSIGGLTSSGTTAAVAGSITGIIVSGIAASMTISNNTIGNATADNMRGGTLGLTTGASLVSGINLPSTSTLVTVSNNTIRNLSAYGTGSSFVRGMFTASVSGSATVYTITGNTISNLTTNGALTTLTNGQACVAGIVLGVGNNSVISQNTIHTLSNINTTTVGNFAAGISIANGTNTTVSRNTIYNITNAGTSVTVTTPNIAAGVIVRSGTTACTIVNNMISLGNGQTTNTAFLGIMCNHGSTPDPTNNLFYNTINIEGTAASGAQPSFGIARTDFSTTARTAPMNIRNNIVSNTRSGGTGKHYAIANNFGATTVSATGWGANASNFNVLNAAPATVGFWTTDQTFAAWQTASAGDGNSYSGITVTFVNTATGDLHLNMGVTPTQMESNGTPIAGISIDFDNQTRPGPAGSVNGGGIGPDIGADEFDGVGIDVGPPVIVYTPLLADCTNGDRILTATIGDISGVPTSGAFQPRIYFRKNAGAYVSTQGVLATGTGINGTWNFTISAAALGGLTTLDVVSYFVIAQDIVMPTPFITSNPSAGLVATDVNTVTTPPTTPNSYVSGGISGTYNVGTGQIYTTIEAAVAAYNGACLAGPVTYLLTDASYTPVTLPITIAANPSASATNTMTIKPSLAATTISGVSTTSIFNLSGADFVTIDGSIGSTANTVCPLSAASRDLTITNTSATNTSAMVWLGTTAGGNAVTNCTVKNCILVGASATTTIVGLGSGGPTIGTGGTNNNDISFVNNDIRACQFGIYSAGASAANKNQNLTINQNFLNSASPSHIGVTGIYSTFTNNITVSGNTVGNMTNTSDIVGINIGFGALTALNTTLSGIADGVSNVTITHNTIGSVTNTGTFAAGGIGLGNTISGTSLIANNMVYGVSANGTGGDFAGGIIFGGGTATVNVFYNTVSMQGTITGASAGSSVSACFAVTNTTAPSALTLRNNIFSNTQLGNTGATTKFIAIGLAYASPYTGTISNNNDLFAAGAGPGTYAVGSTGGVNGTLRTTLLDWQTETGQDAASKNVLPEFASATDLHLLPGGANNVASLDGMAAAVSVTNDIDCNVRNASTPDIGADEFTGLTCTNPPTAGTATSSASPVCSGVNFTLSLTGASSGGGITYQWESSPDNSTWTPISGATNATLVTSQTAATFYRSQVTCGATVASVSVQVLLGPVAGTTASSANPVCSGATFTLSLTGASSSGVTYQWESSPDNSIWTPVGGATSATLATSQTTATFYRCQVTCGTSVASVALQVTMETNIDNCYCSASATSTSFEKISNITFADINNTSSSTAGYENFTTITGNVQQTQTVSFSGTIVNPFSSDQMIVWIDYNHDGDFTDLGETVFTSVISAGPTYTGSITIPATTIIGNTRMRVRLNDTGSGSNTTPCGTSSFGQVEDYTLNIAAPPVCSAPSGLTAGTITTTSALLSWTAASGAVTYDWEVVPQGNAQGVGVVASGNTASTSVTAMGLTAGTSYSFYVRTNCSSGSSSYAGPVNFTTTFDNAAANCGLSLLIPDGTCPASLNVDISVSGVSGTSLGTDVNLSQANIVIAHTWDADLEIFLISPTGTEIELSTDNGGSGDNYGDPTDVTCALSTSFRMDATTAITAGTAPFIGSFIPEGNFAAFAGQNPNGVWHLRICDNTADDAGTLKHFKLVFTPIVPCAGIPAPGNTTASSTAVCPGTTVNFGFDGSVSGTGLTYQWQSSPDNIAFYTDIMSETNATYSTMLSSSAYYKVKVTCSNGGGMGTSEPIQVVVNPIPANDDPCAATTVTVGTSCSFSAYSWTCATGTATVPAPGCASYLTGDVWFKAVVPASGHLIFDSQAGTITDGGMAIYSSPTPCDLSTFTLIECDDDDGAGNMPLINRTGLTPGSTIYVRMWDFNAAVNGSLSLCVYDGAPPMCSFIGAGSSTPVCNNNGTASNSADDFLTFSLNPTGTALGSGYTVSVSSGTISPTSGTYGAPTSFSLQGGSAGAGNVMVTVTDNATSGCTMMETITDPGSCSTMCALNSAGAGTGTCNNNSTTSNPTDDRIVFTLNPTGFNLGANYTVSVSGGGATSVSPMMGNYGSATTFTMNAGSAGGGNVTVTITDASGSGCTTMTTVMDPGSCSTLCALSSAGAGAGTCNNNSTTTNPTDDRIVFTLNPTGFNLGANYTVSVSGGGATSVSPMMGNYGSATTFTMNAGSAGGGNVTVTITDASGSGCTTMTTVMDPGSCSTLCALSSAGAGAGTCNNNGTTSNPTDDRIVFTLNPVGTNLGANYTVSVSGGGATSVSPMMGNYGSATTFTMNAGSAGGGNVTVTITDASGSGCTTMTTVMDPGSCSTMCVLNSAGAGASATCSNNGSNSNPADDRIVFTLNPTGFNLGANYTVSVSGGGATSVSPMMGNYGSATTFTMNAGSAGSGNVTVTITDASGSGCTTMTTVMDPGTCSNNCSLASAGAGTATCNNNGTTSNPTDDRIVFTLNPTGTNIGATYTVGVSSGTVSPTSGTYGSATTFTMNAGSAGAGAVTVTVTDVSGGSCTTTALIADPGTCSTTCGLSSAGLGGPTCNSNGTASNPADDRTVFTLNPTGFNLGATYTVAVSGAGNSVTPTSGTYGAATTFTMQAGSAGSGGTVTVTVTDASGTPCTVTAMFTQPASCSSTCLLASAGAGAATCNNNGTASNPTDDRIVFTLNPTGSNLGATYTVGVSSGSVSPTSGTYGAATTFTMNAGSAGAGSVTVTVTDASGGSCSTTALIADPGSCSTTCGLSSAGLGGPTCNSNGTPSNAADDRTVFTLNPTGFNLGATYTVVVSGAGNSVTPTSGTYGAATTFTMQAGSAGSGGTVTVTVTDASGTPCTVTAMFTQPASCSSTCLLASAGAGAATCNNNGTASNPTDDRIVFTLNPTGANLGATYTVGVSSGSVSPTSGTYGSATTFTMNAGSAGAGNVTVTVTDASGSACSTTTLIADPGTCSSTCGIAGIMVTNISACNNNLTSTPNDDFFTANVTVTFANPPASGTLNLSGDGTGMVSVTGLTTSHTFTGVVMSADGSAISLTAVFSANGTCGLTNGNAGTAPSNCSGACFLTISSIVITNETCPDNSNGSVTINAIGSGQLVYSIDGGVTYSTSNVFINLAPNTYNLVVAVQGSSCMTTGTATVLAAPPGSVQTWYKDLDNDGYSDGITIQDCAQPTGFKLLAQLAGPPSGSTLDCNDNDALQRPNQTWYKDTDNDGYSNNVVLIQCLRPTGYKAISELIGTGTDCNDGNAAIHPGAAEICNNLDDDCDGLIDENAAGGLTFTGNKTFTTQAQLNAWSQCYSVIDGNLLIMNAGITTLANLINIVEVTGNVTIKNTGLVNLNGLNNLAEIGGNLVVSPHSTSLNFLSLDGLEGVISVGGNLLVTNNTELMDCCAVKDLANETAGHTVGGTISIESNACGCNGVSTPPLNSTASCTINNSCTPAPIIVVPGAGSGIVTMHNELMQQVDIFPNPADHELNVEVAQEFVNGRIRLLDLRGSLLLERELEAGTMNYQYSIQHLPQGIYLVDVLLDGKRYTEKLIVE